MTTEKIMSANNQLSLTDSDEISLRELFEKIQKILKYLISKWWIILLTGTLGGANGYIHAYRQPIKYTAKITFVLEDSKGGGSGLASLAGQFGFDLGGSAGGSVFSGDNILSFLKSKNLVRETLLTSFSEKSNETLADRYADIYKLKESWIRNNKIGKINFSKFNINSLPRLEDSLMQNIEERIIENELFVIRPDKKYSFIEAKITTLDEEFSKTFLDRLVKVASELYIVSKTKTKAANIALLQRRADSLSAVLNNKTYSAAASQQSLVDVNPALKISSISSEITNRDKTISSTIFAEVVKNLELSKTLLNQEMPFIQVVEQSTFPLPKEKPSKINSLVLGSFFSVSLTILYLLGFKWFKFQARAK